MLVKPAHGPIMVDIGDVHAVYRTGTKMAYNTDRSPYDDMPRLKSIHDTHVDSKKATLQSKSKETRLASNYRLHTIITWCRTLSAYSARKA